MPARRRSCESFVAKIVLSRFCRTYLPHPCLDILAACDITSTPALYIDLIMYYQNVSMADSSKRQASNGGGRHCQLHPWTPIAKPEVGLDPPTLSQEMDTISAPWPRSIDVLGR